MDISAVITWFTANGGELVSLWLQVIGAASILVKMTPTLKDDNFLKSVVKFTGKFVALNR